MRTRCLLRSACTGLFVLLTCGAAYAQYTGNITGLVKDPTGAAIANASLEAVNTATQVSATTTSDAAGNFQFLSLAPGTYKITAEAQGFRKHEATVTLQTNQTLNVPISLEVGAITEQTTVSAASPLVNTAETRNEMTLGTDSLSTLPLAGHSYISLVTMAPGVSGLGTMGGGQPGGPGGTPGTGVDNYSTETAVDVSANGQGTVANQFIVDGLNVTSGIRQGVLNLTPNPGRDPGDEHPGQHVLLRVRGRQLDPDGEHDEIGIGAVSRAGQRLLQQPELLLEHGVHGARPEVQPVPRAQRLVHGRRPDHSQAAVLLLLRVRTAALLGVDGQPDDLLPGSAVRDVGRAELPQHVRHAHPEHVSAERGHHQRRLQDRGRCVSRHLRHTGHERPALLDGDDRHAASSIRATSATATSTSCGSTSS